MQIHFAISLVYCFLNVGSANLNSLWGYNDVLTNQSGKMEAVAVARRFCEAMYSNNMSLAKSYMTTEDARRTPDVIRESKEVLDSYKYRLRTAAFKVIENVYTDKIVTVRFYDPAYPYLDKRGRWFGCAIELVYDFGTRQWKVSEYGY